MKQVSNKYVESMKSTIRNPSYVDITLIKPEATKYDYDSFTHNVVSSGDTFTNMIPSDKISNMLDAELDRTYLWTGELNQFVLGDEIHIANTSSDLGDYGGFISNEIIYSIHDGFTPESQYPETTEVDAEFVVNLNKSVTITHLKLIPRLDFPDDYGWDKYAVVINGKEYPNTKNGIRFRYGVTTNSIKVIGRSVEVPFASKYKFERLIIGYAEHFTNNNILECNVINEVDPLSRRLPKHEIEYAIADYEGLYDPSNPDGYYDVFDGGEKIKYRYGYDIGGVIEWLDDETYFLKNKPSFNTNKAIFSADKFDKSWTESPWLFQQYSFNARETLTYAMVHAEVPYYSRFNEGIFNKYASPKTSNAESMKDFLQVVANYSGCAFYFDKDCMPVIDRFSNDVIDFDFSGDDIYKDSLVATLNPKLGNLIGKLYSYKNDGSEEVITTLTEENNLNVVSYGSPYRFTKFTAGNTEVIDFTHTCLYGKKVFYHYGEIKGVPIRVEALDINHRILDDGVEQILDNYMFTDKDDLSRTIEEVWLPYLKKRLVFELDYRGNPELEVGDVFYLKDKYGTNHKVRLLSNKISFNGAIRGHMIVKEI